MAYNKALTRQMVFDRLDRLPGSMETRKAYIDNRIAAAHDELERMGIHLRADSAADLMLLVDMTVWQHNNRDKETGRPEWLRMRLRDRFIQDNGRGGGSCDP